MVYKDYQNMKKMAKLLIFRFYRPKVAVSVLSTAARHDEEIVGRAE